MELWKQQIVTDALVLAGWGAPARRAAPDDETIDESGDDDRDAARPLLAAPDLEGPRLGGPTQGHTARGRPRGRG